MVVIGRSSSEWTQGLVFGKADVLSPQRYHLDGW
jgi:hypothetical protein